MKDKSDMNFEAKDFERYYSGEMTGKEMYVLEKAALADPFLQDALEGYKYTRKAVIDIEELQERLGNRSAEKKESKLISWNKNTFLKAAVLIAFLAGAAVIFLTQKNDRLENTNLASTSSTEIKEIKSDSFSPSAGNDLAILDAPTAADNEIPIIKLNKNSAESKIETNEKQLNNVTARSVPAQADNTLEEVSIASAPVIKNEESKAGYLISGKVINAQGEPIPFASIVTKKEQINTDIAGNYSALIKDSSMYGNVVAVGYEPLQKKLSPNLSQTIVLNSDIAQADKIAGVSNAQASKKAIAKDEIMRTTEVTIVNNSLAPKAGWSAYEQYLKDSVRYQNDKRAIVQLTFTVNKQGRPQDIKVIDGLCLPCNKEAIRLLKDGPDWKPMPKLKGLLKVQF